MATPILGRLNQKWKNRPLTTNREQRQRTACRESNTRAGARSKREADKAQRRSASRPGLALREMSAPAFAMWGGRRNAYSEADNVRQAALRSGAAEAAGRCEVGRWTVLRLEIRIGANASPAWPTSTYGAPAS